MAGHNIINESLEEDGSFVGSLSPPSYRPEPISLSRSTSTVGSENALTTNSPFVLEIRQNNSQDCSNLIIASVDRATVEISRTIIRLNATFSQQLQQASISATNGIKSAQGVASSTLAVVVRNASIATSSAFSSVTVAQLAVTSASSSLNIANLALTSASSSLSLANLQVTSISSASSSDVSILSSASSSDVSRLSSSVALLQASLVAVQVRYPFQMPDKQKGLAKRNYSRRHP